jgi:hypothetical protein
VVTAVVGVLCFGRVFCVYALSGGVIFICLLSIVLNAFKSTPWTLRFVLLLLHKYAKAHRVTQNTIFLLTLSCRCVVCAMLVVVAAAGASECVDPIRQVQIVGRAVKTHTYTHTHTHTHTHTYTRGHVTTLRLQPVLLLPRPYNLLRLKKLDLSPIRSDGGKNVYKYQRKHTTMYAVSIRCISMSVCSKKS